MGEDATLSMDNFVGKLKVWNESTTTSPSGRHLGHYKSLIKPFRAKDATDDVYYLNIQREALLRAHWQLLNYCLKHCYSLKRWQQVVNVMIHKEPGNNMIHRLRVIHLFEANYNLVLSVKWRQLLIHADQQGSLNEGQHGSRPGREATTLPFLGELKYEIAWLAHLSYVHRPSSLDEHASTWILTTLPWKFPTLRRPC